MQKKNVLVIVLGYGCYLTEPMKKYLDSVVSFIAKNNVTTIIATGGYTQKSRPNISEAGIMTNYLRKRGVETLILLDERSITTEENLRSATRTAKELSEADKNIVIFCDQARALKVKILARLIFGYWPKTITYDLTKGVLEKIKQIFIATPLDILASQFLFIKKLKLRRKKGIMDDS